MEKAAMIFNGIYFSYPVIDEAFAWAKSAQGKLLGVFLCSKKETGEGYIYPSDLDSTENMVSDAEAEKEDDAIIQNNSLMLAHRAAADQVSLEIKILHDPSEKELSAILNGCTKIYFHENIQEPGIVTVESINLVKFLASLGITLKEIKG